MNPDISKLLDAIPEKPPRSKLQVHADVIAELRRKRRSYREISEFFRDNLAITVAPSTINDFVRVRRRRGKRNTETGDEQLQPAMLPTTVPRPAPVVASTTGDDGRQRIAALKQRTRAEEPQKLFEYNESEPLKLRKKPAPTEDES